MRRSLLSIWLFMAVLPAPAGADVPDPGRAERTANAAAGAFVRGDYETAERLAHQAIEMYRKLDIPAAEAELFGFLGVVDLRRNDPKAALASLQTGLGLYERIGHKKGQANLHGNLLQVWLQLGDLERALAAGEKSIALFREEGDQVNVVNMLGGIGLIEMQLGRDASAIEHIEEAVALNRELGRPGIDRLSSALGAGYARQGRFPEALPLLREVLARAEESGDSTLVADILNSLGNTLRGLGDYEAALDHLKRAEAFERRHPERSKLASVQANIALVYVAQGGYSEALSLYREVLAGARRSGDRDTEAAALNSSAALLRRAGRYNEALERYEEALAIRQRAGHWRGEALVLNNLATLELSLGRLERALTRVEEAAALHRKAGNRGGEATALHNSAQILADLGRFEEAMARSEQSLAVARTSGDRLLEASLMGAQGQLLALFNRHDRALPLLTDALQISRDVGDRPRELSLLKIRGAVALFAGTFEAALGDLDRALALSRELGDPNEESEVLLFRSVVFWKSGRLGDAKEALSRSLEIQTASGPANHRSPSLSLQGILSEEAGAADQAIASYRAAVTTLETELETFRSDDLLTRLLGSYQGLFARLIAALARAGSIDEAFEVTERARARLFLRQAAGARQEILQAAGPELVEQETALRERLTALTQDLREEQSRSASRQDPARIASLAEEIDQGRRGYESLRIRLQQTRPEPAALLFPAPLSLKDAQSLLGEETTLIAYFSLWDGTLAWVADRGAAHFVRLPISDQELARRVDLLRTRIAARQDASAASAELYRILIAPLEPHIRHGRLVIIPHGSLHFLPFAALSPDGGKTFLVEKHALSFLPSAGALPFLREKRSPDTERALVLGDPDGTLPAAAAEARAIASLFGVQARLGSQATEAVLAEEPRPIDYLHVAAHATVEPARPLFSRVELAAGAGQDGALEVHEVYGLDLKGTNLVVLSGCDTGLGARLESDDLVGLSRAFLYAGAPAVVTTLWAIDDEASRLLMEGFYRRLRQGIGPAAALQEAQKELLAREGFRNPWFWAAFQLSGEGGATHP